MEHVALNHVFADDTVENDVPLLHELFHQVEQLPVLGLEVSKCEPGSLLRRLPLTKMFGCLRFICALFLVGNVSLVEILNGALSHLLAVMGYTELGGPVSYLLDSLLHRCKVIVVHLAHVLVNVDDLARFIEVVVTLAEDRPSCFLEALVGGGKLLGCLELLNHQDLHVKHIRIEAFQLFVLEVDFTL